MQPKNNILHFSRGACKQAAPDQNYRRNKLSQDSRIHDSMIPEGPLGDLIKYTSQWTNEAISGLFDNVDTQLFEMAEKSENATDQNTYFDAMRIIRLRRSVAHEEFLASVELSFDPEVIQGGRDFRQVTSDIESLSLIADDNLEEELATHNMIAKAERDNKNELKQLNQRVAYLYNGLNITTQNNPVSPTALCNAFAAAVDTLEAEIKVKLLVFKLFDINIISKLNDLYLNLNHLLVEKGILPDLKVSYGSVRRQPAPSGMGAGIPGNAPGAPQADSGLSQFIQQPVGGAYQQNSTDAEAFTLIQQLIARNKTPQQNIPQAQFANTTDVMNSLSQIQIDPALANPYNPYSGQQHSGFETSALLKEALETGFT